MVALNFRSNHDNSIFYETRLFLSMTVKEISRNCKGKFSYSIEDEFVSLFYLTFHTEIKILSFFFFSFFSPTGITIMELALKKAVHTTTLCILAKA